MLLPVKTIQLNYEVITMSHSITIRLQNPAQEFDAGTSVGFRVKGGVKFLDPKSKSEDYTNYEAALFVSKNNAAQVDFYRKMLVADSIVEVSAKDQAIRSYEGQNGTKYYIELINASAGFMGLGAPKNNGNQHGYQNNQPQQGYQSNHPQQGYNNRPQQGNQAYQRR
jgi:hypothetical protein